MDEPNPYQSPMPPEPEVDRARWPFAVRVGLWGIHTRRTAQICLWGAVAVAIIGFTLSAGDTLNAGNQRMLGVGVGFSLAASWYFASIRWVDMNGGWQR
ncbi:MAG TPA: hypothetical protein VHV55_20065 [Pirellulales bacterium]|jgi:hypothetical protein|nr:hypothetical protein [Pirellulales bacterium]